MSEAAPRAGRGSDPQARAVKLTLLFSGTILVTEGALIAPALPAIAAHFPQAPALLTQLLFTITPLMIALSTPFTGIIADRLGRKPLLFAAILLVAISGAGSYLLDSVGLIVLARALLGVGIAGVVTSATALIGDYYRGEQREGLLGLLGSYQGFAGVPLVFVAGILSDIAWNMPFLPFLLVLILLPFVSGRLWEPEAITSATTAPRSFQEIGNFVRELPWRALAPIYIIVFAMMIVFYLAIIQIPFYLTGPLGGSGALVGISLGLFTLLAGFSALAYSRLRSAFGIFAVLAMIFGFWGVGYAIIGLASGVGLVFVGSAVFGVGYGLLLPIMYNWVSVRTVERNRGRALGVAVGLFFFGQFVSPFVTQPFVAGFGIAPTFLGTGVLLLVPAVICTGLSLSPVAEPTSVATDSAGEGSGARVDTTTAPQ